MKLTTYKTLFERKIMAKHVNNGLCPKCEEIMKRYPGAHQGLWQWFQLLQSKHPKCHISSFGRGYADQEDAFRKGASKAHYGQSSHNYGLAIDIFILGINGAEWPKSVYEYEIKEELDKHNNDKSKGFEILWYGLPGSKFYELPHYEIKGWRDLVKEGKAKLVEPNPNEKKEEPKIVEKKEETKKDELIPVIKQTNFFPDKP